jgi:hypothetical protein
MVPTNDFLEVATDVGANVLSQVDYAASPLLGPGQQPGIALSAFNNKTIRQASFMVAALAQFLVNTTGDDVLDNATQADILATMALAWPSSALPTATRLTATGSTVGYLFHVTTASATVGATYGNNSETFTVISTLSGGTLLFCTATGAPAGSGTLTKASGTGDSTIAFSSTQALAAYSTPANCRRIEGKIRGAGGGGGGGNNGGTAGAAGLLSALMAASGVIIAGGGLGGPNSTSITKGGAGGSPSTLGSLTGLSVVDALAGGYGGPCASIAGSGTPPGGNGGGANGGGGGAGLSGAGANGAANSGSGGGGGAGNFTGPAASGAGGGAGAEQEFILNSPPATLYYVIGTGGAHGTGATSTYNGGDGADGEICLREYYTG